MSYNFDGYQKETCEFLSSLEVDFYKDEDEEEGLGFITLTS